MTPELFGFWAVTIGLSIIVLSLSVGLAYYIYRLLKEML